MLRKLLHNHRLKMHSITAILTIGLLLLPIGANSRATEFDITKTNIKLLTPGRDGLIHFSSMKYSESLPNVTLATFAFTGPTHTDLLTQTLALVNGTTKVFIGARNYVHRLYAEEDKDFNRQLVLDESSSKVPFRNKSACPTVYADQVGLSPEPLDNDLKVLFVYPGRALFACGTDNCGRCETFKLHDFTARRPFYNTEVDNVADFVGGRKSAFVFEGYYKTANTYFVAVEPDGRRQDQMPPFFSARTIKSKQIIYTSSISFYSSRLNFNQQFSSTHSMKILYGFEHNHYSYLLTIQPDSLKNDTALLETRLARICTNDHYFNSYMEIPLVCRINSTIHREAIAATLTQDASQHFNGRLFEKVDNSVNSSLYVSFRSVSKGLANASPLCRFEMAAIEETFRNTAVRCNTNGDEVELLPTLHGTGGLNLCTRVERYNDSDITCGSVLDNGFILGRLPPPSKHIFTLINDIITSIGAVTFTVNSRKRSTAGQIVDTLILGTQKGRLMKVAVQDFEYKMTKFFSQRDSSLGPFLPNPSFDRQTGNFYFLSKRSVTEVPIVRCQVYTTCSACFRSKDECFWNKGQCMFREDVILSERLVQCPPEVINFEPKEGPKQGGTVVAFYGFNFGIGEISQNNKDSNFFKVTIGSKTCVLLERTDTLFTCRIEDKSNTDDSTDNEGAITIFVSDNNALNYHTLTYNIYGNITLEDKFAFKSASLIGVHPTFGPFAGATRLTIAGSDLCIGSNVTVKIGNSNCPVIVRSRSYVICETPSLDRTNLNVTQSKQIEVSIDNSNLIINGDRTIPMNGSTLFNGGDNSSPPQMYRPKRTRQSYQNIEHPFSNISTFINLQTHQKGFLLFGESFQYRPNPQVTGISDRGEDERHTKTYDNFYTIASGQTVLTFDGDHLNSVLYPMLTLYFKGASSRFPPDVGRGLPLQENASSVPCTVVSARRITCLLPPLPREMLPIEVDRPISANYVLHLDGKQLDSNNLPKGGGGGSGANRNGLQLKGTRILYYPDPEFTPVSEPILVSTSSLLIELEGKYLIHDLPYRIFLNDSTKCIVTVETTSPSLLKCKLNMEQEMVDYLYGQEVELSVAIGNRIERIGIVKLQNEAALSTVGLVFIILASLMIVVIICAFVYYKTQVMKSKSNSKDSYSYELVSKSKTLKDFFNEAYTNLEYYTQLEDMGKIIDPKDVQKSDTVLGVGNFGIVTCGKYRNECVAIKTLKRKGSTIPTSNPEMAFESTENSDQSGFQDKILMGFFDEAITMKDFNHVNVLSLVGVTLVDNYPSILLPFMTYGDLATYVRNSMHSPSVRDLLDYAIQVARGMTYLASKNFVHRDLAARNCLIGQFNGEAIVKVADFGLSRKFEDKEYYRINGNKELPYRWMPPESLNGLNIVTSKSDVWSYGVLVWELTTRGQVPYGQLDFSGVLELLKNGQRLTRPQYCPDIIFSIMSLCWLADVNERPEFKDVLSCMEEAFHMLHLQESNTYVNLSEQVPSNAVNVSTVNQFDYRRPDIQEQVQQYFDKSRSFLQYLTNQNPELYEDMELDGDGSQYPTYAPPSYSAATAMPSESIVMTSAPTTSTANGYGFQETHFLPKSGVISSPGSVKGTVNGKGAPSNGDYLQFSNQSTLPR